MKKTLRFLALRTAWFATGALCLAACGDDNGEIPPHSRDRQYSHLVPESRLFIRHG